MATLEDSGGVRSQAFRFPAGRPLVVRDVADLGLRVTATTLPGGDVVLQVDADRLVYGLRIDAPGFAAGDDAFSLEPGHGRRVVLRRASDPASAAADLTLSALNLRGTLTVGVEDQQR